MQLLRLPEGSLRSQQFASNDPFSAPVERVIAQWRLVLCALGIWALYSEPPQYPRSAFWLLVCYSAVAAALAGVSIVRVGTPAARLSTCLIDIAAVTALLMLTGRAGTPFLALLIFILFSTSLRWGLHGVLAMTAVLLGTFLIASLFSGTHLMTPFLRGGSLLVIGAMFAYVTAYRERHQDRLRKLTIWPPHDPGASLEGAVAHAAQLLGAPRILVVWEDGEEPHVQMSYWENGAYRQRQEAPGTFGTLVSPELTCETFLTEDPAAENVLLASGFTRSRGPLIEPDLAAEFSIASALTAPFAGELCTGRVFILDRPTRRDDDLLVAEMVAARIGIELDRQSLDREQADAIANRERVRLTRDLHDSILQNLTAISLRLSLCGNESARELHMRIDLVKRLVGREQARIRSFVEAIAASSTGGTYLIRDLEKSLSEFALNWNCKTSLSVEPRNARLPRPKADEVSLMLAEAVANAVRHGRASEIDVSILQTGEQLLMKIRDNGTGFSSASARGQKSVAGTRAPTSLSSRIADLAGTLAVSSTPRGAELEIRLPAG
jgi:signal transduction histidine kinase